MSPSLQVAVALDPPSTSKQDDLPEKPVCANCRSSEISFDATACWDTNKQQFDYDIFGDKVLCIHCNGKQRVDWVAL